MVALIVIPINQLGCLAGGAVASKAWQMGRCERGSLHSPGCRWCAGVRTAPPDPMFNAFSY